MPCDIIGVDHHSFMSWCLKDLTHWGRDKIALISQTTFSSSSFVCKLSYFDSIFTQILYQGSIQQ